MSKITFDGIALEGSMVRMNEIDKYNLGLNFIVDVANLPIFSILHGNLVRITIEDVPAKGV